MTMLYCNRLPKSAGHLPCHRELLHKGPCAHDLAETSTIHYLPPRRPPLPLVVLVYALVSLLGVTALGLLLTAASLIWESR